MTVWIILKFNVQQPILKSQQYEPHLCPSIAEFGIAEWQTVGKAKTKPYQQFVIRQCKGEGSGQQYKPLV